MPDHPHVQVPTVFRRPPHGPGAPPSRQFPGEGQTAPGEWGAGHTWPFPEARASRNPVQFSGIPAGAF